MITTTTNLALFNLPLFALLNRFLTLEMVAETRPHLVHSHPPSASTSDGQKRS